MKLFKNKRLLTTLGLGGLLAVGTLGATIPFVVSCSNSGGSSGGGIGDTGSSGGGIGDTGSSGGGIGDTGSGGGANKPGEVPKPTNPNGNQIAQNAQYNITGEFANIYTSQMFEKNKAFLSKWDGSNELQINIDPSKFPPNYTSTHTGWQTTTRNYLLTKFNASGNVLEIEIEMEVRLTGRTSDEFYLENIFLRGRMHLKFEYLGTDKFRINLESTILSEGSNISPFHKSFDVNEKEFLYGIWLFEGNILKVFGYNTFRTTFETKWNDLNSDGSGGGTGGTGSGGGVNKPGEVPKPTNPNGNQIAQNAQL